MELHLKWPDSGPFGPKIMYGTETSFFFAGIHLVRCSSRVSMAQGTPMHTRFGISVVYVVRVGFDTRHIRPQQVPTNHEVIGHIPVLSRAKTEPNISSITPTLLEYTNQQRTELGPRA